MVSKGNPDYKYIIQGIRRHKSGFKKEKLGIKGELITESDFMKMNNIHKIFDCGKIKFTRLLFNKFEAKLVNVFISILRFFSQNKIKSLHQAIYTFKFLFYFHI